MTTPLESRGSPACLTVVVDAGMSPPAIGEPSLALSLEDLAAFPRIHRGVHALPRRFTMTVDTRTAVAKPLRPHHRSRSDATALAGSFSPQKMPRSRLVKT